MTAVLSACTNDCSTLILLLLVSMQVQSTNDCSTLSKVSAASLGYFEDEYQKYFVNRKCRRSPLIHRGYCVRSQAVTFCIREFIRDTQDCSHRQIVSLGCGFDSLFFRLRTQLKSPLCVWEVDFPSVVNRKRLIIQQSETLTDLLGSHETPDGPLVLLSQGYKLLGVDLSDVSSLTAALEGAGIAWDCPTLILGEVALCYMDPERSTALIGWAAERFRDSRFVLYEQSFPSDPFGRVMMSHFASLNSPLLSLTLYPHIEDQECRFLHKGWQTCRVLNMNQFCLSCVALSETLRIHNLEPFDEFEELHLKCSHYFILVASQGFLAERPCLCPIPEKCADGRLLHSLTPLSEGRGVLVLGGRFSPSHPASGALMLKHMSGSCSVEVTQMNLQPDIQRWRHTATEVHLSDQPYVFVFGGRSVSTLALQDTMFLCLHKMSWEQVQVIGCTPSARHSHSSCSWKGGAVISGGLLPSGLPSGSIDLLVPCGSHFSWRQLETSPSLTPRYSHSSHVIGEKLLLVGGVWIQCEGSVPGVSVVDVTSGHVAEYQINTWSLEWPLMAHGHSSVLLADEEKLLIVGGGGNCFSFGTHLNPQPVFISLPPDL
ncbi:tRNA wybutosine-synthesizing protein 4 isoform X2 [Xenopus laevis]|uniref:tRNA wybutosine-synthesizing protein 4 n=1 Tax=Xenopus laevis TaxID=8355 RepID=A0A8J1MNP1_XENLA|nr:tRNA wybutosine-synthesizing protein 4 isoform X2 [Xenopus laevis]